MRILDRYIAKSVITTFLASIFSFFFLYIIIDIFSQLEEIIEQKVSVLILRDYYLSFLPTIFIQTAPIACLLSILFCLGKLNSNNEIIPMRSAGLNSLQISKAVIVFSILVSVLIFTVNENIVPVTILKSEKIKMENIENPAIREQHAKQKIYNLTFYGFKNRLYFIDSFYPKNNTLEGITILEQDEFHNINSKIYALKGEWQNTRWVFYQCQIFYFDSEGQIKKESQFYEEKIMDITETPEDFVKQQIQISFMNIKQLKDYISRFSGSGAQGIVNSLKVDLYQRIAYPFSNLVITFMGLPFALMKQKRKGIAFVSIGICLAIGFLYYVVNAVSIALGKTGLFLPSISAWLPNIIFICVAFYLFKRIS